MLANERLSFWKAFFVSETHTVFNNKGLVKISAIRVKPISL